MKLIIEIDIDASETIVDTIRRGTFSVKKDGSGHKLLVGDVVVPGRKCRIKYNVKERNVDPKSKSPS